MSPFAETARSRYARPICDGHPFHEHGRRSEPLDEIPNQLPPHIMAAQAKKHAIKEAIGALVPRVDEAGAGISPPAERFNLMASLYRMASS